MNIETSDRQTRREIRRKELVEAAAAVFLDKGVSATSVDDIVRGAGVAKGTFYLYFGTKDDVVNAVAERMVEGVANRVQALATDRDRSPVERLLAFGAEVSQVGGEPYELDLIEVFHRPENRAIHDRMGYQALARLAPAIEGIVADGIDLGLFRPQDPGRASGFVMACFGSLHEVVTGPHEVPQATAELNSFILRGLGYQGEIPT
ncbi:MAG: TetR/AcrR family transcriptional regulator [Chloroflexota bacterium]